MGSTVQIMTTRYHKFPFYKYLFITIFIIVRKVEKNDNTKKLNPNGIGTERRPFGAYWVCSFHDILSKYVRPILPHCIHLAVFANFRDFSFNQNQAGIEAQVDALEDVFSNDAAVS